MAGASIPWSWGPGAYAASGASLMVHKVGSHAARRCGSGAAVIHRQRGYDLAACAV